MRQAEKRDDILLYIKVATAGIVCSCRGLHHAGTVKFPANASLNSNG